MDTLADLTTAWECVEIATPATTARLDMILNLGFQKWPVPILTATCFTTACANSAVLTKEFKKWPQLVSIQTENTNLVDYVPLATKKSFSIKTK